MRTRAALAGALCCAGAAAVADPGTATVCAAGLRSDRHDDALALRQTGRDDWSLVAPRNGRNLAYIEDEARLQCEHGGWTFGLLARSHAVAVVDAGSLQLAAQVDRGERPAADAAWDVHARWRGFTGAGLVLGRMGAPAPGWTLQGEAQLLRLAQWRERRIAGPVQYSAGSASYTFDLQSQETSSRLDFPFAQPHDAHGLGLLFGAELAWESPQLWARAGLRDAGWLRWRGIPQQQETLSTSTQAYDADGFLVYQPLIEGRNSQNGLRHSMPPTLTLAGGWRGPQGRRAGLLLERVPDYGWLPRLQWQQATAAPGGLAWRAEWRLHERRLGLGFDWKGWSLDVATDSLGRDARSRLFALGYSMTR